MSYGWWFLVILLTSAAAMLGTAWFLGRGNPPPRPERQSYTGPLLELPRAGYFDLPREFGGPFDLPGVLFELSGSYGPFPVDTGPLLILSEQAAARADLEREIPRLCAEAEAKIPPRWR